ncbi:MAG: hypothetical protein ACK55Z_07895, partial [bacterium]
VNSEGWFQCWSLLAGCFVVLFWAYISDSHFCVVSQGPDDEDNIRIKDAKSGMIWERVFWSFTYQVHG